jgi:hypothetical protein
VTALALHVPDEPVTRADIWLAAVVEGADLDEVLCAEDGLVDWLWARWSSLRSSGLIRDDLAKIVSSYRREIWLWLAGERTWAQCCAGLVGRISRRVAPVAVAG